MANKWQNSRAADLDSNKCFQMEKKTAVVLMTKPILEGDVFAEAALNSISKFEESDRKSLRLSTWCCSHAQISMKEQTIQDS